jgi:hypothetical protein
MLPIAAAMRFYFDMQCTICDLNKFWLLKENECVLAILMLSMQIIT